MYELKLRGGVRSFKTVIKTYLVKSAQGLDGSQTGLTLLISLSRNDVFEESTTITNFTFELVTYPYLFFQVKDVSVTFGLHFFPQSEGLFLISSIFICDYNSIRHVNSTSIKNYVRSQFNSLIDYLNEI